MVALIYRGYKPIEATCVIHFKQLKTKEDAAKAYNEMAIKLHGEFASLNVIQSK